MIKALTAVTIAAFAAFAITILPSFSPPVEASVPQPLAKTDRLPLRALSAACAEQNWPNINASCLRGGYSAGQITPARVVTADRG